MKPNGLIIIAFALTLSSCAVTNSRYTEYSAKSIDLADNAIYQTPTVVDLKVKPELVSIDTTWTESIGRIQTNNFTSQKDASISRLLELYGGDLLVQPKYSLTYETNGASSQKTNHLTVSGYIAKYENFRTATQADIDLINESKFGPRPKVKKEENPTTTIYVNSAREEDNKYLSTDTYSQPVRTADPLAANNSTEQKEYARKTGIKLIGEFQYTDTEKNWTICGIGSIGWQSDKWFFGIGTGWTRSECFLKSIDAYYSYDGNWFEYIALPIFTHARWYLTKTMISPYIDVKAGIYAHSYWDENLEWRNIYSHIGCGISIGLVSLGMGFNLTDPEYPSIPLLSISVKI